LRGVSTKAPQPQPEARRAEAGVRFFLLPYSQKGYWTTRGYANSRIANSRTGHLADWSTRGLDIDNSRTGQVADWTTRGCHQRLCVLSFRSFGGICETASCPVRDLSSPRVGNPRVGVSASCPVTTRKSGERCRLPQLGPGWSSGRPTVVFLYFQCPAFQLLHRRITYARSSA